MPYRVDTVTDDRIMRDFINLPFTVYKDDPNWIAPLSSEIRRTLDTNHNPYFFDASLQPFVCYKDAFPVARICVIINSLHWEKFRKKTAFFGFFESLDDETAAGHLFEIVQQYCKSKGVEFLEGPFNPNHYSELGLQINEFGMTPIFFETYNPEYYLKLLESNGFKISYQLHTRTNWDITNYVHQHYGEIQKPRNSSDFVVRHFNVFDLKGELERIREVYNDAFSDNWYFLPVSREEYLFSAKYLFFVTYPKLIAIIEHKEEPVGVLQCVLNINPLIKPLRGRVGPLGYLKFLIERKHIRDIVIYAIGVKKAYQHTRVYKLLVDYMCWIAQKYRTLSTTWLSADNLPVLLASKRMGLTPRKQFAIYEKVL